MIPCQVPDSTPPAFVHFQHNAKLLDNAEILNGDTLLLSNVSRSMTGNYSCVVSNHITNEQKTSPNIFLNVQESSRNEKSRMVYSPKDNYEVKIGESVDIPCTARGVPTPEIIWSKMIDGAFQQINETKQTIGNGILHISNVDLSDNGMFLCAVFDGGRRYVRRTTVTVLVPPELVSTTDSYVNVPNQGTIELPCQASGSPPPFVDWRFNGQRLAVPGAINRITGQLVITNANADEHTGFYQCFAQNKAGEIVSQTFVQVGGDILSANANDQDYDVIFEDTDAYQDYKGFVVAPPSRPNVTQVSADSLVIAWDLEKTSAQPLVPIKFFKIQFREFFRGKGRSAWQTMEEVIGPEVRAFEILGLHSDRKYRFRIIVVYENNDSQISPLSRKFRMNGDLSSVDGVLSPRPNPPQKSPEVSGVVPLGPTSLRLGWVLDTSNEDVEGYFIYFKPAIADEKYKKVTIIGATSHSHIIEALIPGMEYAIKVPTKVANQKQNFSQ